MNRKGFTLIEVLISLLILAMVSGFFVLFFKVSIYSRNNSRNYFAALNLAQGKMEELRAEPFDSLKSDGNQLIVNNISSDLKEITITLNWNIKKPPIILYTMRAR
ncbi:MAG: prepilin-type N-terminal cleavage/methylation domain-containing protein [Candidatus Margulisiibacteriota bacterium]